MPNSVTIEAQGLRDLHGRFAQTSTQGIQQRTDDLLKALAGPLVQRLKETAPRSSGQFRTGPHLADLFAATPVQRSGGTATVSITNSKTVGKWSLAELLTTGTRPHNIPNAFGWGQNVGTSGRFAGYWHPGTAKNPFIKKAVDSLDITHEAQKAAGKIVLDITGQR